MRPIRIIGAGGHGKVVAETAAACGYADIAFLDDAYPARRENGCWTIVGLSGAETDAALFCAIGNNTARAHLFETLRLESSPVLIHPAATLSPSARLGAGTLVVAGAVVNADVEVGRGVILNTCCSIDHDCILNDFVHVSPGARLAGNVRVGARSWIGIGAVVREGVTIGEDVLVAAGAAVVEDLPNGVRVGGVPARPLNIKDMTC